MRTMCQYSLSNHAGQFLVCDALIYHVNGKPLFCGWAENPFSEMVCHNDVNRGLIVITNFGTIKLHYSFECITDDNIMHIHGSPAFICIAYAL